MTARSESCLVLLAMDNAEFASSLSKALPKTEYRTRVVLSGTGLLQSATSEQPDLVILDPQLEGSKGFEVLRTFRERFDCPLILISSRQKEELDCILGLELGADDYMNTPFSPRELTARIQTIFRRSTRQRVSSLPSRRVLRYLGLQLDYDRKLLSAHGKQVDLTVSEFFLLRVMMASPARVFTREELVLQPPLAKRTHNSRAVDMHIVSLRRKINELDENLQVLKAVRGVGYRFQ